MIFIKQYSVVNINNSDKPELHLHNPTYDTTLVRQLPMHQSTVAYDIVSQPPSKQALGLPQSRQSYDKLDHERQIKGKPEKQLKKF